MRRLIWAVLLVLPAVCVRPGLAAEQGGARTAGVRGGEAAAPGAAEPSGNQLRAATTAPTPSPVVPDGPELTESALTVTLRGYREWMRPEGEDDSSPWAEADKEQRRERREAWEQAMIRRLVEYIVPVPEAYRDKFAASSKGLTLNFAKGWSMRLRFRPALELSYRFK